MPLLIVDEAVNWSETEEKLNVKVTLSQPPSKDMTILSSSQYLKISSPPYFWECFLNCSIDSDQSIARIDNSSVVFELLKVEKGLWGCLKHNKSRCAEFCKQKREEAIKEIHEKIVIDEKNKSTEKHERHRLSIRKQMEMDENERKRVDDLKENERKLMTEYMEHLENKMTKKTHEIVKKKTSVTPSVSKELESKQVSDPVGAPRKSGNIFVNFTPRVFPTAARESQAFDEMQWLEKQAAARQTIDLDTKDLNPNEKNPVWLKEKGDTFFARGDFHSAVNAYNLAIRICPTMHSLFSNRAACHLKLRNLHKAVEDSSKALELMGPPTNANSASCYKCHVRRAVAFCQLELYVEGLMDFEAALKLQPCNEELKADAEKIRTLIQSA